MLLPRVDHIFIQTRRRQIHCFSCWRWRGPNRQTCSKPSLETTSSFSNACILPISIKYDGRRPLAACAPTQLAACAPTQPHSRTARLIPTSSFVHPQRIVVLRRPPSKAITLFSLPNQDLDLDRHDSVPPLHSCLCAGAGRLLKEALRQGADIDIWSCQGHNAWCGARSNGPSTILLSLLKAHQERAKPELETSNEYDCWMEG